MIAMDPMNFCVRSITATCAPPCPAPTITTSNRILLKHHHAADACPRMHQVEALVDLFESHNVGYHRVDLDLALHIHVDDLGHVGAALGAAERGAAPVASGDELERPRRDFLASLGDADDDRGAPAAVTGFQR